MRTTNSDVRRYSDSPVVLFLVIAVYIIKKFMLLTRGRPREIQVVKIAYKVIASEVAVFSS